MRKHIKKILTALFLTALFSVSMVIHTRNNGFPYFYHMTEPSKAEQITTGHYNLYPFRRTGLSPAGRRLHGPVHLRVMPRNGRVPMGY